MIFNAILKNPKHEEYGETTALFPIPPNEYEPILEHLEVLELGTPLCLNTACSEGKMVTPAPL